MQPRFKSLQVGGADNDILVGLDGLGIAWINRVGSFAEWTKLDTFDGTADPPAFVSIVLWGDNRDMLEALDHESKLWSLSELLDPYPAAMDDFGTWLRISDLDSFEGRAVPPKLTLLTSGAGRDGRGNVLFALDEQGVLWTYDPAQGDSWLAQPAPTQKEKLASGIRQ